jgi:hypothetical protein
MLRKCTASDQETMQALINEAARAYKDVIPEDRWHEPYEKNGYALQSRDTTRSLLRRYWSIPERQIETSVVLANWRGGIKDAAAESSFAAARCQWSEISGQWEGGVR